MMDEIKVGDEVEIRVTVLDADRGDGRPIISADGFEFNVRRAFLLAGRRVARPLAPLDPVRIKGAVTGTNRSLGALLAIDGGWAGVKWASDFGYQWLPLSYLERAPAPDTKEGT